MTQLVTSRLRNLLERGGRVIVLGAPRTGKSKLAARVVAGKWPFLCTDPVNLVTRPEDGVEYVPEEHAGWSQASQYVADVFLTRPGPWLLEGVGAARALRKWRKAHEGEDPPCELVVWARNRPWDGYSKRVLDWQKENPGAPVPRELDKWDAEHKRSQRAMGKGIETVMRGLRQWLMPVLWEVELEEERS